MPIPIANNQEQFKAPKVAQGKAVDASKEVAQAYEPAFNTLKLLDNAANSAVKFAIAQQRSDSTYKAQNALNEYMVERDKLDNWFKSQTYELAKKNLPTYYAKSKELHNKFVSEIDTVKDGDIRESYRQHANMFNIKEYQSTEAFVYEQKIKAEDEALNNSLIIDSDMASRSLNPYNTADKNAEAFTNSLNIGLAKIDNMAAQRGWPKELTLVKKQQWIGQTFNKALLDVSSKIDNGLGDPLEETRNFIDKMRGLVPEDVWLEQARHYDEASLDLAYAKNPTVFFNDKGIYDDAKAAHYASHLNAKERYNRFTNLQRGNHNNGSAERGAVAAGVFEKVENGIIKNLKDAGVATSDVYKISNKLDMYKDKFAEMRFNSRGAYKYISDAVDALKDLKRGNFWYNAETDTVLADNGNLSDAELKGYQFYNIGPVDDTEAKKIQETINNLNNILGQMGRDGTLNKVEFGSKWFERTLPSAELDFATFFTQMNYDLTKDGFFTPLWRKMGFVGAPELLDENLINDLNDRLKGNVSEAVKQLNEQEIASGYKNNYDQNSFIVPSAELIQSMDNLDRKTPLKNGMKRWDYFEIALAETAKYMPQDTVEWIKERSSERNSPGENYYDMINLSAEGKQSTFFRDYILARQRKMNKLSKKGLPSGFLGAESIINPLKVSVTDKQKSFSFADSIIGE